MGIYDRDYYQGDELRPLRPWDNRSMVTLLIFANAAVYIVNYLFFRRAAPGMGLMDLLALDSDSILHPLQWYRFVSYGFAHDPRNIFHVLFNMLSLYFLGRNVEDKYGKWEFFRFYMSTIVVCGLVWALLRLGQGAAPASVIGASGAVTAVALLFVYSFPQATLLLYGIVPVKAWLLGIIIIVTNVFSSNELVATDVHLVGAAFATAYFFGKWNFSGVGDWFDGLGTLIKKRRRGLKVHRPEVERSVDSNSPSKDESESDRILEKIHREGKDSLTSRERKFLERYSREIREKRKQL
ncbi:MAG: rhomboid family intramembrane serine protease [Aureliella sp.]